MAEFELLLTLENGVSQRYPIPPSGLVIGRLEGNDVVLKDALVSRRHARVSIENKVPMVEDLGSINGIELNGKPVFTAPLQLEDVLRIGKATFRILPTPAENVGHTVITPESAEKAYKHMLEDTRREQLPVLYSAAQLLGTVFDLDELLAEILVLIFQALPVRRGYVLTMPDGGGQPQIRASFSKENERGGPPISHTMINHVFERRDAILTLNAQEDDRFEHAASIIGHSIHSAMCAPLCGRHGVAGVIYVDSGASSKPFAKEDLELLAAIARVVGIAVENARLYQTNMQHERFAAIGEAVAGLGHCVKNILTGIRGGGEFIDKALATRELKYVDVGWPVLNRAIERIDMLVMNMLSYSKERIPQRFPVDLNGLVDDVIETVRHRAEHAKVVLTRVTDGELTRRVDNQEIFRLVLNLVVNAIDACEENGGSVEIACASAEGGATITVSDNGPGIPPDILPRLFQAFVSSKGSAGTGLGLACCYKIAREHGGDITVDSLPDQGAKFTVFLADA